MPLTRYQIRNEYSLADPELYKAADKDDPEALLEGVAMAGLVGVLRQLGDLAEFAAEIFHDLHEEVMATAARGHGLMVRVQQLEAEFPSIEKAFLSQTSHSPFFSNRGVDWHPNLRMEQNLITRGDLPRCVMDSYEECRGPPRLFLLDKFDVAGAGACLKRYTDPSFFKVDAALEVQREKKMRKVKKKGSRWRNGETPEIIPTSHAKLHQLFLEESIEKGHTDPARLVKLKKRQLNTSPLDSTAGKSYMEKFLETSPEHKVVREISIAPLALKQTSDNSSESGLEILDISTVSPVKKSSEEKENICSSPNLHEVVLKPSMRELYGEDIDRQIVKIPEPSADVETDEIPSILHKVMVEKEIAVDGEEKMKGIVDGDNSDDMNSEVDNYMDALTTMESEMETDNEYRPKTDYLSNVEKYQMDSDKNEEKLEFQAHFSDSQSVGNCSASDDGNSSLKKGRSSFSYSDTLSNVAETTLSDGEGSGKVFPSSEAFVAETTETPSNRLLAHVEVLETKSRELALPNEMSTDEDNIHDRVEASSSSCHVDSNPTLLPSDPAARSLPQNLYETPSGYLKSGSESSYVEETETNLIDSLAVVSDAPSQTRNDSIFTLCSQNHPVDNVNGGEPSVTSNALLHLSNNSELAREKKSSDDSIDGMLQTDFADESCPEKLISIKVDSPQSITSPKEEEIPCLALPQAEACSDVTSLPDSLNVVKPYDLLLSEVDDAVPETGIYPEVSTSMLDTSRNFSFEEQQVSNFEDNMSQKLDSAEKLAMNSEEANLEDIPRDADNGKVGVSTCKVDAVEGDVVPPELPSDSIDHSVLEDHDSLDDVAAESVQAENIPSDSIDHSVLEDHDSLDDVAAESVQAENMFVSTAALDDVPATTSADDNVDNAICLPQDLVCSPSSNLVNFPECPFVTKEPNQEGLEIDEPVSPECLGESEAEDGTKQLEVAPKDHESASSELVSYDNYKFKIDDVQDLSLANSTQNSMSADGATIASASSALPEQELETKCLHQNHVLADGEETMSSPAVNLPDLEICSEQSLKLKADQLDVESVKAGASSNISNHQSELIHSSEHLDQEKFSNDASESCQEDLQSQSSPFEYFGQLTGQEINSIKQTVNPLGSFLPSFGLLHETNQINLEEMPPLPPLPPMQWRLGKNQHAQPFSQGEPIDYRQLSFPSIPPFRDEEKAQSGFSDQQRGIVQPGNPFLPRASKEVEKLHLSEPEEGKSMQLTLSSLQMPTVINDASNQQNGLALEGTQSLNPFLTLSTLPNKKPDHGLLASVNEDVQSSSNPFLSVSAVEYMASKHEPVASQGNIIHPQNQLAPETALEDEALQQMSQNSERDHGHPSDVSMLPPRKVEEQPQHSSLSEGETAWLSNPFTLPTSEVGKANGSTLTKLPRPRNPLIDAVAALDKSKLRKVTERVKPQNGPNVDERDSLLEQIRTKSFNLKPAVVSRPSIHGPKTNLKVAAILEKANAIRQATAGSDEDDDEDNWSDS